MKQHRPRVGIKRFLLATTAGPRVASGGSTTAQLKGVECELAVLATQCLSRRITNIQTLGCEIAAWQIQRNRRQTKINGQFGADWARVRLKRLYPPVEHPEDTRGQEAS